MIQGRPADCCCPETGRPARVSDVRIRQPTCFQLVLLGLLVPGAASADPAHLRVRTTTEFEARATWVGGTLRVAGTLRDDAGVPLSTAKVEIGLAESSLGPHTRPHFHGCASTDAYEPAPDTVVTSATGAFCIESEQAFSGAPPRIRLSFRGDEFHDGVDLTLAARPDAPREATTLRFDPLIERIDLSRPEWIIAARLRFAGQRSPRGSEVVFENEAAEIGRAVVEGDGRAHLRVSARALGSPGAGVLRARFAGDELNDAAQSSIPVTRTAVIDLNVPKPIVIQDGQLRAEIEATSSVGFVSDGTIELLIDQRPLLALPIRNGRASLNSQIGRTRPGDLPLEFRYVPSSLAWVAGKPLRVVATVQTTSFWKQAFLVALVLLSSAWVIFGAKIRVRLPKFRVRIPDVRRAAALPGLAAEKMERGGVVIDRHTGHPVSGALVRVELASFEERSSVFETRTDDRGQFSLEGLPLGLLGRKETTRLSVSAPNYRSIFVPLNRAAGINVQLVARKRYLVDRLVDWAGRRGPPFSGPPEPTPHAVAQAATGASPLSDQPLADADAIRAWALRVADTAFGPATVDEAVEKDISSLEPSTSRAASGGDP